MLMSRLAADARRVAVITSHQQRLVFDNCSDRRIDNGIPRQRAFAC
jgi:hypothetical protein